MYEIKLKTPIMDGDQEIKELTVNFDILTGNDIINIDAEFNSSQGVSMKFNKESDKGYLAYVVARAAGVNVSVIKKLPANHFSKATLRAQNFLLF